MEQNNQDYYFELIGKYLTKEATEFEKNLLLEWVQSSEGNKKIFNDTKELWNLTSQEEPEIKFDAENAWLKIRPAMITANQNTGKPLERGKVVLMDRPWKPYLKIAAMLTLVCSVIFLISRFQKNNSNERLTFKTTGERKTIFLPDSSKIYLNKNTTFSYNSDFLSERKVYLQLEAFFEVRKSEGKTFVI